MALINVRHVAHAMAQVELPPYPGNLGLLHPVREGVPEILDQHLAPARLGERLAELPVVLRWVWGIEPDQWDIPDAALALGALNVHVVSVGRPLPPELTREHPGQRHGPGDRR